MATKKEKTLPTLPEGYQAKSGIAWGSRVEGLLEISFWNLKRKNALTAESHVQIARLVKAAQNDEKIKVILFHGGLFYSSGNDLDALVSFASMEPEQRQNLARINVEHYLVQVLKILNESKKPIVGLCRGQSIGIGFTMMGMFDFIYCSPDAKFSTPFMKSSQSPEGASTYTFAQQFGIRRANEILLLDKTITAQEAVQCGFANGIIEGLNDDHWPDISKIPAIGKLLATDYRTLVNCKELLNAAKDNARIEQVITREARALVECWEDENFPPKLVKFMQSFQKTKQPEPKL